MYYLHHYFDPDFNHMKLSPKEGADGSVDCRYLGYVQNVVAGQLLAEIIDLEQFPGVKADPRFIYKKRVLPQGPNVSVHPDNPDKLIAATNGYCFYHEGLISVKRLLNVRGNLGFSTGNIFFVNDISVHGDVQTGFAAQANNLLIKGHIESAKVKAAGDIVCLSGVKGANTSALDGDSPESRDDAGIPSTLLDARGNIRLPFCEHVQLRARGNVVIDGSCMHSTIYVGGNLVIKGRLQGGTVYANGVVLVEGQLGNDYTTTTRIMMGYDPFEFLKLQKLESQIRYLNDKTAYFEKLSARNQVMELEYAPRLELLQRKLKIAHFRRTALWKKFTVDEQNAPRCRVIAPGKVMPGCEIGIAKAYYKTDRYTHNVAFYLENDDIVASSPATHKA